VWGIVFISTQRHEGAEVLNASPGKLLERLKGVLSLQNPLWPERLLF